MRLAIKFWTGSVMAFCLACSSSEGTPSDDTIDDPSVGNSGGDQTSSGSGGNSAGSQSTSGSGGNSGGGQSTNGSGGHGGAPSAGSGGNAGGLAHGGSSGGSGQGGAGGATIPIKVGNCANLPAVGKWEMIAPVKPTLGDSSGKNYAEAIIVDPFDPAVVWFGTGFAGIFKSPDCGSTWIKVNTGRNAALMDQGSHISIAIDPIDRGTMYAVSLFGTHGLWKTTNGGTDWDQLFTPDTEFFKVTNNFVDAVAMDPTDHLHLSLGMHTGCSAPYAPTCTAETFDGGKSWKIVKLPTAGWEEGAGPAIMGAKHWTYGGNQLWLTTDGAQTWTNVTPKGTYGFNGGEVTNRPIVRTSDGTYVLTSNGGFVTSKDGITWSLLPNFNKRVVSLTLAGGRLYAADQWSKGIYTTLETNLQGWTTVPPMTDLPNDQGEPFIDYDPVHHVLYTSHFAGGMWRVVTE